MKTKALWQPPKWHNLKTLWVPPEYPHIKLVAIENTKDLVTWASYMGHSGARYQKWVIDTPIWHFYTFLDEEGWPHMTIHAKDRRWWNISHPDDDAATYAWPWGLGPSPIDKEEKAKYWLPSTAYEDVDKKYNRPCYVDNTLVVLMGVGHIDKDPLTDGEETLMDEWYSSVFMPDLPPLSIKRGT